MGRAIAVRTDYTAGEIRGLAKRVKHAALAAGDRCGARWSLADRGSQDRRDESADAARLVIRFNDQGPDGLINVASPGVPPKLDATHRAFLARIVEEGPIPAVHGVVGAVLRLG